MTVTEKVAYLKGLAEGLGIDESNKEGKVLKAVIDALEDVAFSLSDLEDGVAELCEQVDMIDEDLDNLEQDFYDDEDDYDYEDECGCGHHHHHHHDDEEDDDVLYEVECPTCGDTICVNEEMLDEGHINCPNCDELLEFTFDDVDEDEESEE